MELTTFADALVAYRDIKSIKKRGAKQEVGRIRLLLADPIAGIPLTDLKRADVRALRDRVLARGATGSTWNRFNALVNAVGGWCLAEFDVGPGRVGAGLAAPENSARTRRLGPNEYQRLLAATDGTWLGAWVTLAVETTLRRGSIAGLRWEDIDWERRTAFVALTKNGSAHHAPLSSRAVEALQRHRGHYERSGKVFPVSADAATHAFLKVCRRIGITGLRLHDLRAEGVSRLFEAGWAANEIAAVSTHRNYAMLMRYARHNDPASLALKMG